jgi:hypothetical protein
MHFAEQLAKAKFAVKKSEDEKDASNRGNEPTGVIILTYVEIAQGNSLCSYLYYKQAKIIFFLQHWRTGGCGECGW